MKIKKEMILILVVLLVFISVVNQIVLFTITGLASEGSIGMCIVGGANITTIPNQSSSVNSEFSYQVICNSDCGEGLTYNHTSTPSLVSFSIGTSTGLINFTPQSGEEGDYNVSINCSKTGFSPNSTNFSLTILSVDNPPNVTLVSPAAGYSTISATSISLTFNCSVTDDNNLTNISLYTTNNNDQNFILNQSMNISGTSNTSNWTLTLALGTYTWNCLAYDSSNSSDWGDVNRTITISAPAPSSSTSSTGGGSGSSTRGGGGIIVSEEEVEEEGEVKREEGIEEEIEEGKETIEGKLRKLEDKLKEALSGKAFAFIPRLIKKDFTTMYFIVSLGSLIIISIIYGIKYIIKKIKKQKVYQNLLKRKKLIEVRVEEIRKNIKKDKSEGIESRIEELRKIFNKRR